MSSKPGQGGDADHQVRDLRAELLQAEAAHFAKIKGGPPPIADSPEPSTTPIKRELEDGEAEEDAQAKRRRILEETRDIDAESEDDGEDDSSEDDSDDEDETAELQRELEKIKRERAEKREQEVRTSISRRCCLGLTGGQSRNKRKRPRKKLHGSMTSRSGTPC